ncbi:TIGR03620 family F420-dependent LLM class oxidoreductase [Allosaccharopolyspora coralli]|uniref:TIGR03620 family F420-dependent LLM class oxidoreductase n=1 Tax=Allosaccharopolyspora coralli TaxID=2665642 RepID=A0A5Q3QA40_9PSEU|nr:TIGR03620 family F420-dependent LLM class oxidoreductase [Allosaccharopolyspora coralli]QGK70730.1 TIGR03620 family F420-dependent LLM class oxidoreductase [Allosaccharopolyspora coralli]
MTKIDFGPVGVALNVSDDDSYVAEAAELETLGYSSVWLPGGELDSLERLADLLAATRTVPVAPAIIPPDVYADDAVAAVYARLERTHPGRFIVGLGSPHRPRQLRALNDYLDRLDAADPPVPAERRILAALGPRNLELARDRAAGAVPLLVTPGYTAWAREILGAESTLVVYQLAVADTDPHRARRTAREPTLRGLLGVGGYADNARRMGFSDQDIAELSDRLVDGLIGWGDETAIAGRVQDHLNSGADHVVLGDDDQPGAIEVARQLAPRLAKTAG